MAITVLQAPTTPNVTNTNLMYVLESDNVFQPQFRYVADIYVSGSEEYITTLKTYPNINESGIIDISRELNDQLSYDLNWKNYTNSTLPVNARKTFDIRFGEEYALTLDATSSIYPGTGSNFIEVFPGTVYKNEGSYNFNTSSIVDNILSNHPDADGIPNQEDRIWVNDSDYHTVTFLAQDTNAVVRLWRPDNTLITSYYPAVGITGSFGTVGIGPQNFLDGGVPPSIIEQTGRIALDNLVSDYYTLYLPGTEGHPCGNEYTRFAFINEYGTWDYYNIYNPLREMSKVERNTYDKSFTDYSSQVSGYNISNRGTKQYYTEYSKSYEITTDYLTQGTAQWLTELLKSPEVYIQSGVDFLPIIMTPSSIEWNMNQFRQKLFQYTIQFQYANQPQPR